MKRFEFQLQRVEAVTQNDLGGANGADPYIWVTYFFVDATRLFENEPVTCYTPMGYTYKQDLPDNMNDGQISNLPGGGAYFYSQILNTYNPVLSYYMAGCIVVMFDQNQTSLSATNAGLSAYSSAIRENLNELFRTRVVNLNTSEFTQEELQQVADDVSSKVKTAIKDNLSLFSKLFDDQDRPIGITYAVFTPDNFITAPEIDFPPLVDENAQNIFRVYGRFSARTVVKKPSLQIGMNCDFEEKSVTEQQQKIRGLQAQKSTFQQQLRTAPPQNKARLIDLIRDLSDQISDENEILNDLLEKLDACKVRVSNMTSSAVLNF